MSEQIGLKSKREIGGNDTDKEAADLDTTRIQHEMLRSKMDAFRNAAQEVDQVYYWKGFSSTFRILDEALAGDTNGIPDKIFQVYDAALAFTSFLEFDNDLRSRPATNYAQQLSAEDRRLFIEIVRSVAPWVRRFPSARVMDEEAGRLLHQAVARASHTAVIESAASNHLISSEDRALILSLINAIENKGFPAQKAGLRAVFTTRNLVYVILLGGGAFIGDAAKGTEIYKRSTEFVTQNMDAIIDVISDAPQDIRIIAETIAKEIRDGNLPDLPDKSDVTFGNLPSNNRRKKY